MKIPVIILTVVVLSWLATASVLAEGYPWRDHAPPFTMLFGNHIDTHQQSKLVGNGALQGFFYIRFTGSYTAEGYPEAEHADCVLQPDECTVGWMLRGIPIVAKLIAHSPGHPIWCVDPADLPRQPGYTHFQWLDAAEHASGLRIGETYAGFLLKLTARDFFFFRHQEGVLVTPGIDYVSHNNIIVTDCD